MDSEVGYEKVLQLHIKKERAAVKLQSKVGQLLSTTSGLRVSEKYHHPTCLQFNCIGLYQTRKYVLYA